MNYILENSHAQLYGAAFRNAIAPEIRSQTRALIASNQQLLNQSIRIENSVNNGFERISYELSQGMNQIILSLAKLDTTLKDLLKMVREPSQTWAYEQFGIAQEALGKQLYDDAITYANYAINGHGDHTGYRLFHRFHLLVGLVHLGVFENTEEQLVDYEKAEVALLDASKYAQTDASNEAAFAMLCAGIASFQQQNLQKASDHIAKALSLNPSLAEGHFQSAKITIHEGVPESAIPPLEKAIELDRNYVLVAYMDEDFKSHSNLLDDLIEKLKSKFQNEYLKTYTSLEDQISRIGVLLEKEPSLLFNKLHEYESAIESFRLKAEEDTLFGYQDAHAGLLQLKEKVKSAVEAFLRTESGRINSHKKSLQDKCLQRNDNSFLKKDEEIADQANKSNLYLLLSSIVVFFLLISITGMLWASLIGATIVYFLSWRYLSNRLNDKALKKYRKELSDYETLVAQKESILLELEQTVLIQ